MELFRGKEWNMHNSHIWIRMFIYRCTDTGWPTLVLMQSLWWLEPNLKAIMIYYCKMWWLGFSEICHVEQWGHLCQIKCSLCCKDQSQMLYNPLSHCISSFWGKHNIVQALSCPTHCCSMNMQHSQSVLRFRYFQYHSFSHIYTRKWKLLKNILNLWLNVAKNSTSSFAHLKILCAKMDFYWFIYANLKWVCGL